MVSDGKKGGGNHTAVERGIPKVHRSLAGGLRASEPKEERAGGGKSNR